MVISSVDFRRQNLRVCLKMNLCNHFLCHRIDKYINDSLHEMEMLILSERLECSASQALYKNNGPG